MVKFNTHAKVVIFVYIHVSKAYMSREGVSDLRFIIQANLTYSLLTLTLTVVTLLATFALL